MKIVQYCEDHDIALTWIGCPISDFQLLRRGEYDNYVKQLVELAEQYKIPYYDFSLCKREYLDLSQNMYWSDMGHLNTEGAEIFTQFLGEFLLAQETGENTYEDCFYSSYEEKLRNLKEEVFGLEVISFEEYEQIMPDISEEQWEESVIYRIRPVTNAVEGNVDINVKVVWDDDMEESIPVIRKGNDAYVIFSADKHGVLRVEAKLKDSAEMTNWVEMEY